MASNFLNREFQSSRLAQWTALLAGGLPMYALALYGGFVEQSSLGEQLPDAQTALRMTLFALCFFGGLMLACLVILNGQSPAQLNLQPGSILLDLAMGFGGFALLLLVVMALGVATALLGGDTVPDANLELGKLLASDQRLAAVFLGPVVWLQAAVLEEFSRVFMLSRLWRAHPGRTARSVSLAGVALLFGLAHIWQGWYGVLGTGLIGGVLGWLYMRFGRVMPLIIAHGLYDTVVLLMLIAVARGEIMLPDS